MFSTGQLIFAAIFFFAFIIIMIISYKRDRKTHKKEYKGTFWVLIGFVVFLTLLVLIKYFTKN
ncbi:hypothetical protein NDQ75_13365 [Galbibacter mesophilus]|nr:hypothetical protein [Galbibacter mesophilus]MCM5663969.1 hypothetical protein [Galbibacter mesophilus]